MNIERLVSGIWHGEGSGASLARFLLSPAEAAFRAAVSARNHAFDTGKRSVQRAAVPVVSVGNLNVGGSGKTPIAAHIVALLANMGRRPAVVMRGYGNDELFVHQRLNPHTPVVAEKDRVVGAARAMSEFLSDVIVLDDAFQHRALYRDLDIVVFSADAPFSRVRLIPAGPWREPLDALKRASMIIVSRKAASDDQVNAARDVIGAKVTNVPVVMASLRLDRLHSLTGEVKPLAGVLGKTVLMLSAIANPAALSGQLAAAGAELRYATYRDHHAFTAADIESILRAARGTDLVVCTLKDVVKLQSLWPREGMPLWYVSQAVELESGGQVLLDKLDLLFNKKP